MKNLTQRALCALAPLTLVAIAASSCTSGGGEPSASTESALVAPASTPGKTLHGVYWRRGSGPFTPPTACASPALVYGGGQVISNVEVVQVNWGPNVAPATISLFESWYPTVVASAAVSWLKEYDTPATGTNQTIGTGTYHKNPASTGSWTITPINTMTALDDTQIAPELFAQIKNGKLPTPTKDGAGNNNTLYMIDFPPGVTISLQGSGSCQAFCGYHETGNDATVGKIYYGVHPDMGVGSGCEAMGGKWRCGGSVDPAIATAVVHGHEMTEAITDPENNSAWLDSNPGCGEIGDICANELGTCGDTSCQSPSVGSLSIGGTTYYMQTEWSNAQNDCVDHGPLVTCTTNTDCNPTPNTPICDATTKTCRACVAADCTGATPACETSGTLAGECVQCTQANTTGCTGGTPFCNTTTDTCRACTASDCTAPKAICETSGAKSGDCVQCDGTNMTACVGMTPHCDTMTFTCVDCNTNADCTAPKPICDTGTNTCRACNGNGDCTGGQVCDTSGSNAGSCVDCVMNTDCTTPTKPVCNTSTNKCGPCTGPGDCPSGTTCNTGTGACSAQSSPDGGGGDGGGTGGDGGGTPLPDGGSGGNGDAGTGGNGDTGTSSGCSVTRSGTSSGSTGALAGILLGLALVVRRRVRT